MLGCGVLYRLKFIDVTTTPETARCRARFIERDSLSSSHEIVHRASSACPRAGGGDPPRVSDRIHNLRLRDIRNRGLLPLRVGFHPPLLAHYLALNT